MKTEDTMGITGNVDVMLFDKSGSIKAEHHVKNMVVTMGKKMMAERFVGTSTKNVTHIVLGEGTAATTSATIALGSPLVSSKVAAVLTTPQSGQTFTYTATFPAGTGTGALTEVGEFHDDGTTLTLFARTVFPVVNKQADDILVISWTTAIN
jgi:hypothetical protein